MNTNVKDQTASAAAEEIKAVEANQQATQDTGTTASAESTAQEAPVEPIAAPEAIAPATPEQETAAPKVVTPPAPAPKPAPVAQQVAQKLAPTVQSNNFKATLAAIQENGTSFQKNLLVALEAYVSEMAPGKRHLPDDGAMKQYTLWVTIRNLINNAPLEEFKNLWSLVLAFFVEYKEEAMHERFVFRFAEHWRWAKHELDGFQRVLNLIKLTAEPKARAQGLKQIDLNRALVLPITDEGRNRLLNFYR